MCVCVCVCAYVLYSLCLCLFGCVNAQECDKKESDSELNAKASRERYHTKCNEMGIKVGSLTVGVCVCARAHVCCVYMMHVYVHTCIIP